MQSIKGHYQNYMSVNSLRNTVKVPINFNSSQERFKDELKAQRFAETTYMPKSAQRIRIKRVGEVPDTDPIGRPLWKRELSKHSPSPSNYIIKRDLDVDPKRSLSAGRCTFGSSHEAYRKNCHLIKNFKVFEQNQVKS